MAEDGEEDIVVLDSDDTGHMYHLSTGFVTDEGDAGASEVPVGSPMAEETVARPIATPVSSAIPQSTVIPTNSLQSVPEFTTDHILGMLRRLGANL